MFIVVLVVVVVVAVEVVVVVVVVVVISLTLEGQNWPMSHYIYELFNTPYLQVYCHSH